MEEDFPFGCPCDAQTMLESLPHYRLIRQFRPSIKKRPVPRVPHCVDASRERRVHIWVSTIGLDYMYEIDSCPNPVVGIDIHPMTKWNENSWTLRIEGRVCTNKSFRVEFEHSILAGSWEEIVRQSGRIAWRYLAHIFIPPRLRPREFQESEYPSDYLGYFSSEFETITESTTVMTRRRNIIRNINQE